MQFQGAFTQIFILLVPILIGCLIRKIKIVDESFAPNLSRFVFNVSLPCTILHAMQMDYGKDALVAGGKLMLICIVITVCSFGISALFVKLVKTGQATANVYQFSITFSNFSYMAYPIAQGLYGETGLFYAVMFSLPLYVIVNSIGIILLYRSDEKPKLSDCKKAINMPTIAVAVGVLLYFASIKLTGPVGSIVSMLDSTTTPLAMVIAGLILAEGRLRDIFADYRLYLICFLRLILLPVLVYLVMRLLGFSDLMLLIPVLVSAMPVISNIVLLTANGKGDSKTAADILLLSVMLSMITIPVMATVLW